MSDTGLEQLAKLSGTSADRVEDLLSLLKAPASLTHLVLVMSNLQRALKAIQEIEGLRENLEEGDEVEGQASPFKLSAADRSACYFSGSIKSL